MATMADLTEPESATLSQSLVAAGQVARERVFSFGVFYVAIFVFLALYLFTIRVVEQTMDTHFQLLADEAVIITELDRPIALQIQEQMRQKVERSDWVTMGGVVATTLVMASDGVTWIYVNGHVMPQPEGLAPTDVLREAVVLLPARADVSVTLPHNALLSNAILIAYTAILLQCLYLYNRSMARREDRRLRAAVDARDETVARASRIEQELEQSRQRLNRLEPAEREHTEEIQALEAERQSLQTKLGSLLTREQELRGKAEQAVELSQEVHALEDLLEEASSDLMSKDDEIRGLETNLKRAAKSGPATSGKKARGAELLARRLRTLYKSLEVDERAIDDLIALRDETMKLKAEEKLKRLEEEADNVAVRRKVGGLPDHLSIFELGFAGKGRIYYTRGKQQRFRILAVGAKNSQDADLDYLRRLGREEMT
jgi:hypothetical protein